MGKFAEVGVNEEIDELKYDQQSQYPNKADHFWIGYDGMTE